MSYLSSGKLEDTDEDVSNQEDLMDLEMEDLDQLSRNQLINNISQIILNNRNDNNVLFQFFIFLGKRVNDLDEQQKNLFEKKILELYELKYLSNKELRDKIIKILRDINKKKLTKFLNKIMTLNVTTKILKDEDMEDLELEELPIPEKRVVKTRKGLNMPGAVRKIVENPDDWISTAPIPMEDQDELYVFGKDETDYEKYYLYFRENYKNISSKSDPLATILKQIFEDQDNQISNRLYTTDQGYQTNIMYDDWSGTIYEIKNDDLNWYTGPITAVYVGKGQNSIGKTYLWFYLIMLDEKLYPRDGIVFLENIVQQDQLDDGINTINLVNPSFIPPIDFLNNLINAQDEQEALRKDLILNNMDWFGDSILKTEDGKIAVSKVLLASNSEVFYEIFKRGENYMGYPKSYIDVYQKFLLKGDIPREAYDELPGLIEFSGFILDFYFMSILYMNALNVYSNNKDINEINQWLNKTYKLGDTTDEILGNLQYIGNEHQNIEEKLIKLVYKNLKPFESKIITRDGSILVNRLLLSAKSPYFYHLLKSNKVVDIINSNITKKEIEEYQKYLLSMELDHDYIIKNIYRLIDFGFFIKDYKFVKFLIQDISSEGVNYKIIDDVVNYVLDKQDDLFNEMILYKALSERTDLP